MTLAAEENSGFRGQEVELWVKSNTCVQTQAQEAAESLELSVHTTTLYKKLASRLHSALIGFPKFCKMYSGDLQIDASSKQNTSFTNKEICT